jgi:hypothetical protein
LGSGSGSIGCGKEDRQSTEAAKQKLGHMAMAILTHEIWEEIDERGNVLPGVCLAGPDGEGFRKLQKKNARCVLRFEAGSHFDAMTIYYRWYGWGIYTSDLTSGREPYPDEWAKRQSENTL